MVLDISQNGSILFSGQNGYIYIRDFDSKPINDDSTKYAIRNYRDGQGRLISYGQELVMIYAGRLPRLDIVSYKSGNVCEELKWTGKYDKGFILGNDCDSDRIVLGLGYSVIAFRLPYLNQKLKDSLNVLEEQLEEGRKRETDLSTHEDDESDTSEPSTSKPQSSGDAGDTSEIRSDSKVDRPYRDESHFLGILRGFRKDLYNSLKSGLHESLKLDKYVMSRRMRKLILEINSMEDWTRTAIETRI